MLVSSSVNSKMSWRDQLAELFFSLNKLLLGLFPLIINFDLYASLDSIGLPLSSGKTCLKTRRT